MHVLADVDGQGVLSDANGSTVERDDPGASHLYAYDDRGRMTLAQTYDRSDATFAYNALGERVFKESGMGGTKRFVYDESGQMLGEYGGLSREYIWLEGLPVGALDVNGAAFVVADGMGTPRRVDEADGSGRYWEWLPARNPFGEGQMGGNGSYVFNLRFPGQYADPEIGVVYNGHRYYNPSTGRYIQSDPIGLAGGISTYLYASANPLSLFDPLGLTDLNLFKPGSPEYRNAQSFTSPPGTYVVGGHGNPLEIISEQNGSRRLSPQNLAAMIQADPSYTPGETVLLLACNTGVKPGPIWRRPGSFAQILARALQAPVQAPDNFGWLGHASFQSSGALSNGQPVSWDSQTIVPHGLTQDPANPGTIIEFHP